MPTSLASRPSANPVPYRPVITSFLEHDLGVEAAAGRGVERRRASPGSRPNSLPMASASTAVVYAEAPRKLFSAFIACPEPSGPVRKIRSPSASSTGTHLRERVLVLSADHERQRARLGPGDPAGDRRVDHPDAARARSAPAPGADRVGRAHVEHHRARRERGGDPALPAEDGLAHGAGRRAASSPRPHASANERGRGGGSRRARREPRLRPRRRPGRPARSRPPRGWRPSGGPCCRGRRSRPAGGRGRSLQPQLSQHGRCVAEAVNRCRDPAVDGRVHQDLAQFVLGDAVVDARP